MEKRKEKADLEQLLNSLIEKGWKPRWLETKRFDGEMYYAEIFEHYSSWTMFFDGVEYSIRELVSKESWLWQFVCENNLNYSEDDSIYNVWLKHYAEDDHESPYTYASPVWYIIESSLKDESELENFLLDNIKID